MISSKLGIGFQSEYSTQSLASAHLKCNSIRFGQSEAKEVNGSQTERFLGENEQSTNHCLWSCNYYASNADHLHYLTASASCERGTWSSRRGGGICDTELPLVVVAFSLIHCILSLLPPWILSSPSVRSYLNSLFCDLNTLRLHLNKMLLILLEIVLLVHLDSSSQAASNSAAAAIMWQLNRT